MMGSPADEPEMVEIAHSVVKCLRRPEFANNPQQAYYALMVLIDNRAPEALGVSQVVPRGKVAWKL